MSKVKSYRLSAALLCASFSLAASAQSAFGQPAPPCCLADLSGDSSLDIVDAQLMVDALLNPPAMGSPEFCAANVNEDLAIDGRDIELFLIRLTSGIGCAPPVANCQERDPILVDRSDRVGNVVADDFTPAVSGDVTNIFWWGAFQDSFGADCQGIAPDTFEVRYYADDGEGVPGALIGGPFSQAGGSLTVGGPVATGGTIPGPFGAIPEYEFSGTHAPVPVAVGQCYWIEITNQVSPFCEWFWESSSSGNGRGMMDGQMLNGTLFVPPDGWDPGDVLFTIPMFPADHAFCLNLPLADPVICLPPPATNDDCVNAKSISGEGVFAFDTTNATTDGPQHPAASCNAPPLAPDILDDVWFCWTAPCPPGATGTVTVATCDRVCIDTRIAVYDGCACPPSDANLLACDDNGCPINGNNPCTGQDSTATFQAVGGQSYLIRIGSTLGISTDRGFGTFEITVVCDVDTCQLPNRTTVINSDRTNFIGADDFTPTTTGAITDVTWWGIYGTNIPTPDTFIIQYYTDAQGIPGALIASFKQPGTLTVVGPTSTGQLIGGFSEFEFTATHAPVPVTAGVCYWIEISNPTDGSQSWFWEVSREGIGAVDTSLWSVQDGTPGCNPADTPIPPDGFDPGDRRSRDLAFCLNLELGDPTQCAPPLNTNDDCGNAAQIAGEGIFPFDIMDATLDGPPHAACVVPVFSDDQITQDVWAVWTSTCTGDVLVDTCGLTVAPTKIAVYDGSACPATDARLLACNSDSCGSSQSRVAFTAVAGQQYLIRLGASAFCFGNCDGFFSILCTPVPANDRCEDAIGPLAVPSSTTGSTKFATMDSNTAFTCGNAGISSPGVWYTVTGTGNTMTASLCNTATNFCTRVSVFCGDCTGLTCVAGAGIPVCTGQTQISWCSQAGAPYSILVHGNDFILDRGPFQLDVSDDGIPCANPINCLPNLGACCKDLSPTCPGEYLDCMVTTEQDCLNMGGSYQGDDTDCPCPINDLCADATGPLAVPSITFGSTSGAGVTSADEFDFPDCGTAMNSGQSAGVWYTVLGTGTTITASLCNLAITDFDTQLSVYCGDCTDPICVKGNDNFCPPTFGGKSQVAWCAEAGTTYLILVHGGIFARGCFELELTEDGIACAAGCPPLPPTNDDCADAIGPLAVPSSTLGSTDLATVDPALPFCGTGITGPGVWYTVVGTGNTMTATTCTFFGFDTKLIVYCGDCQDRVCIGGNNDDVSCFTPALSTFNWCSQAGATYFILVHGFGPATGDFQLDILDDSAACTPVVTCP